MQIKLTNTGKRYNREWIFRHVDFEFLPRKRYAITGPNGSGKSTLLQVVAGAVLHSEGTIDYLNSNSNIVIPPINAHKHLSIAAPYLEMIEELSALEMLNFHATFKPFVKPALEILEEVNLEKSAHKQIRYFSSGMKQRLKLAQAFFSATNVLMLDEPTTNLDAEGIALYQRLIGTYANDKMLVVSSNDKQEYDFCEEVISIVDYK